MKARLCRTATHETRLGDGDGDGAGGREGKQLGLKKPFRPSVLPSFLPLLFFFPLEVVRVGGNLDNGSETRYSFCVPRSPSFRTPKVCSPTSPGLVHLIRPLICCSQGLLGWCVLPIQEASSDLAANLPSSSSCGRRMALKPRTVPMLRQHIPLTTSAERYCKVQWGVLPSFGSEPESIIMMHPPDFLLRLHPMHLHASPLPHTP